MKLPFYKKFFNLFLISCSLSMAADAQIQWGVKGGFNFSEMLTSGTPTTLVNGNNQTLRYYPITAVHGGIFFSIPFAKKWIFQPEVLYSLQGSNAKPEQNYYVTATEDYRLGYLNVPLLIKYKLPMGFFVETGPQVGLLLSGKINETLVGSVNTFHYDIKSQLKSTDISWTLGAGYCSPINVGFDVRYNLGLTNINQASTEGLASAPIPNGTVKNSVIQLGVFYIFGKKTFNPPAPSE